MLEIIEDTLLDILNNTTIIIICHWMKNKILHMTDL